MTQLKTLAGPLAETLAETFAMASVGLPVALMLLAMLLAQRPSVAAAALWRTFARLSAAALVFAALAAILPIPNHLLKPWMHATALGSVLGLLVQLLGSVIGAFSSRYMEGEAAQQRYITPLAGVLCAVHVLLLADHWIVLISAWALVGLALQHLLCFYQDRPFALLAAYKKRIADRLADGLLVGAMVLAWSAVGSGSLTDLFAYVEREGLPPALQISTALVVIAVILRSALLPVHGWLIQVMEAPTPVSALLHAGVVNLGGFVLIRLAPVLEQAMVGRVLLITFGLGTAILAGLVMLTRISIKVRLAWSTVAQMGFMLVECGLGLYTLAAFHLLGHSLYKAHAFLSASTVVRETRLKFLRGATVPAPLSVLLAPALAIGVVLVIQSLVAASAWPCWWSAILGLAWAPLLWLPAQRTSTRAVALHTMWGLLMTIGLTSAALLIHALPMDIQDKPNDALGWITLLCMTGLYLCLVLLQLRPEVMRVWRRWSYAGFYLDEAYTRLALQLWPGQWTPQAMRSDSSIAPT